MKKALLLLCVALPAVARADTTVPPLQAQCGKILEEAKLQVIDKYKVRFEHTVHCGPNPHGLCFPSANGMKLEIDLSPQGEPLEKRGSFVETENGWTFYAIDEEGFTHGEYEKAVGPARMRFKIMTLSDRWAHDHPIGGGWARVYDGAVKIVERAIDRCLQAASNSRVGRVPPQPTDGLTTSPPEKVRKK
jgi:hypothetical protein